ncbi:MAG TPA: HD domain-containing protein [Candidatus Omnitrophota bacterium]|nr:HD domain-containing protein [Candidatus Omnitrophota bacterium]
MARSYDEKILDFFAEAGTLKRLKRSGWGMTGSGYEESVAEHSFRCAVIGYVLSKMEKVDPYEVLMMTLFNDIHEARIGDSHKVAHRYVDVRRAEKKAFGEQMRVLPDAVSEELSVIRSRHDAQVTPASLVARDADILECLIQAKEFYDMGYVKTKKFFTAAPRHLKTKSAKRLWKKALKWDSSAWWKDLGKFER